jgi:tRNA-dihydrouridine synthase
MSDVAAHWDVIKRAAEIAKGSGVLIMGNGDVESLEDGIKKTKESGVDGIMVGRGIFGNPWFFNPNVKNVPIEKKLHAMVEHAKLFKKELSGTKNFSVMKKHFKAYANGFSGAKEFRAKLMETNNAKEVEKIVRDFLKK